MKRLLLVLVSTFALSALAASGHGDGKPKDKAAETSEFILHHVADGEEFELEIPFPPYHLPALHVSSWF